MCQLQHCLVRAGVCISRIIFLTGASNNHNDSFPLSFPFCLLLCSAPFSTLPCYLPLCFLLHLSSFPWALHVCPGVKGGGGLCCCGEGVGVGEEEGEGGAGGGGGCALSPSSP